MVQPRSSLSTPRHLGQQLLQKEIAQCYNQASWTNLVAVWGLFGQRNQHMARAETCGINLDWGFTLMLRGSLADVLFSGGRAFPLAPAPHPAPSDHHHMP